MRHRGDAELLGDLREPASGGELGPGGEASRLTYPVASHAAPQQDRTYLVDLSAVHLQVATSRLIPEGLPRGGLRSEELPFVEALSEIDRPRAKQALGRGRNENSHLSA
jgi:hypothetical protein